MKILKYTTGNFEVNSYLVYPENARQALLVDAGEEPEIILEEIRRLDLELVYLVNTHGHADHVAGNRLIIEATGASLLIHQADVPFLSNPILNLSNFVGMKVTSPPANRILQEGEVIALADLVFNVLHTPGHTPGHITLLSGNHAFVGDVIFHGSVGRTDFPGSSGEQLITSIHNRIYTLPDDTILYPGHGPVTRVGDEKYSNPFVSL